MNDDDEEKLFGFFGERRDEQVVVETQEEEMGRTVVREQKVVEKSARVVKIIQSSQLSLARRAPNCLG